MDLHVIDFPHEDGVGEDVTALVIHAAGTLHSHTRRSVSVLTPCRFRVTNAASAACPELARDLCVCQIDLSGWAQRIALRAVQTSPHRTCGQLTNPSNPAFGLVTLARTPSDP
eukprot:1219472-Rhodomonas_salina.1